MSLHQLLLVTDDIEYNEHDFYQYGQLHNSLIDGIFKIKEDDQSKAFNGVLEDIQELDSSAKLKNNIYTFSKIQVLKSVIKQRIRELNDQLKRIKYTEKEIDNLSENEVNHVFFNSDYITCADCYNNLHLLIMFKSDKKKILISPLYEYIDDYINTKQDKIQLKVNYICNVL